jgi:hypothetical protein
MDHPPGNPGNHTDTQCLTVELRLGGETNEFCKRHEISLLQKDKKQLF